MLDVAGCLVMPGLVNTHTHLAMNLFRGAADDVSLEEFLDRLIAAELAQLTADTVAVGVEAALEECLRAPISCLDLFRPHVVPNTDIWSAVAYNLTAADGRHTIVDGRVLSALSSWTHWVTGSGGSGGLSMRLLPGPAMGPAGGLRQAPDRSPVVWLTVSSGQAGPAARRTARRPIGRTGRGATW